jgi:hypothetical protein
VLEEALAVNCLDWLGPAAGGNRQAAFSRARPGRLHSKNRPTLLSPAHPHFIRLIFVHINEIFLLTSNLFSTTNIPKSLQRIHLKRLAISLEIVAICRYSPRRSSLADHRLSSLHPFYTRFCDILQDLEIQELALRFALRSQNTENDWQR